MYIHSVTKSAMLQLYLRHGFYIIFNAKHKLYIASGMSAIRTKIFWVDIWYIAIHKHISLQTGLRNIDYGINGTWRV